MNAHQLDANGGIINTIVVDALDILPNLIDADLHGGSIGDVWDGQAVNKVVMPFNRVAAGTEIDNAVAAVYGRFTRFEAEYTRREAQAQAYADGGFVGDVPQQVAAFAAPAGVSGQAAATLILSQAAQLRGALDLLGVQRMRKYEVLNAATDAAARASLANTLATVAAISASLN